MPSRGLGLRAGGVSFGARNIFLFVSLDLSAFAPLLIFFCLLLAEFKHDKFLRGKHHLLPFIKRSEHYEGEGPGSGSPDGGEVVASLKGEVSELKGRISSMTSTIEQLSSLVDALLLERSSGISDASLPLTLSSAAEALSKKRKVGSAEEGFVLGDGSSSFGSASAPLDLSSFSFEDGPRSDDRDEATLFAQLSIDSAASVGTLRSAMVRTDSFEREMVGFDFSEGAVDTAKTVSSEPAVPPPPLPASRADLEAFSRLLSMGAQALPAALPAALPSEPYQRAAAEGNQLMRTTSLRA